MIKAFILDSNIEEISHKGYDQITDNEFKVFGKHYTLDEFAHALNHSLGQVYNQSRDHIRFIEI